MKKIFLAALLWAAAGSANAIEWKTAEAGMFPYWGQHSTHTFNADGQFATFTVQGVLLSWEVEAIGADVTFNIAYASGTQYYEGTASGGLSTATFLMHTSSNILVRSGTTKGEATVRAAPAVNPEIRVRALGAGGTAYVNWSYLKFPAAFQ